MSMFTVKRITVFKINTQLLLYYLSAVDILSLQSDAVNEIIHYSIHIIGI